MTAAVVQCPDCGALVSVPVGAESGDLIDCPSCAGHSLRILNEGDRWSATLADRVSCPNCDEVMPLPEGTKPGDSVSCCGRTYRLTFEFGAFAAEEK